MDVERGRLLLAAGRYRQALEAARAALVDDPHDDDALLLLARANLRLGDFREALRAAEAVAGGAHPADVHVVRALSLDGLGRRRQALAAALEATRAAPEWAGAHIVVAEVARSSRRHRRTAWDAAAQACRLAPEDAEAHATMGSVALTRRRSDVAERAFREALRLDPSHAGARHGLGVVQTERGSFGPAADSFVAALRTDPSASGSRTNLHGLVLRWVRRPHTGTWYTALMLVVLYGAVPQWYWLRALVTGAAVAALVWWTRRALTTLSTGTGVVLWRAVRGSWFASVWSGCVAVAVVATALAGLLPPVGVLLNVAATCLLLAVVVLLVGCASSWIGAGLGRLTGGRT